MNQSLLASFMDLHDAEGGEHDQASYEHPRGHFLSRFLHFPVSLPSVLVIAVMEDVLGSPLVFRQNFDIFAHLGL